MSESPPRRLTRRNSSIVNRIETDKETIFFNSPDEKNADIVHQIVPEIRIAKEVFDQPGTAEKVRKVSQQIKTADEAVITRRRSLLLASTADTTKQDKPEGVNDSTAEIKNQSDYPEVEHQPTPAPQPVSLPPVEPLVLEPPTSEASKDILKSQLPHLDQMEGVKGLAANNISTVDTPTTILSRNVMYKESDNEDTSSDSSSSDSEVMTPQSMGNASPSKWRWGDVCFCCWSRK